MKPTSILAYLLSISTLALAACGTSSLGGNGGGGSGGGGGSSSDGLCGGKPSPVSCTADSCPSGYACTPDADPSTCHPSNCSCDQTNGWVCTADCGMNGSSCTVATTPATCGGKPSPVSCAGIGCPDGFTCTVDPDPTTCHSSSCSCEGTDWVCTADCGTNGSTCVQGL